MEHEFKFRLGQSVELSSSGEKGEVIGAGHFKNHTDQYQVRYVANDGRLVESWWDEEVLTAI